MLRHAYYKAYFPVDSGTPPLGLGPGGPTFVRENTPTNHMVASGKVIFHQLLSDLGDIQQMDA